MVIPTVTLIVVSVPRRFGRGLQVNDIREFSLSVLVPILFGVNNIVDSVGIRVAIGLTRRRDNPIGFRVTQTEQCRIFYEV